MLKPVFAGLGVFGMCQFLGAPLWVSVPLAGLVAALLSQEGAATLSDGGEGQGR